MRPFEMPAPRKTSNLADRTAIEFSAIGKSAQRKASLRLIPLIGIGYGLAYIDRLNLSFASLQLNRDLHFSASVYGFGAGMFFIGYALCEVPSNLLMLRYGARRWLARIMFTWGLLAARPGSSTRCASCWAWRRRASFPASSITSRCGSRHACALAP
jgi:sugar phosphate permease